jgi:uncharacterized RDD family membrane protein YckC
VKYEDRIAIPTPEGIDVELTLAGIGSRFIAALIDGLIKIGLLIALVFALFGGAALVASAGAPAEGSSYIGLALFFVASFLITFGYDVLFETLGGGRTPGKRWTGLRVVRAGGHPVGFMASTIRNLMRLVDGLPGFFPFTFYGVGVVSIAVTRLNQRVGDVAAGTLVVREVRSEAAPTLIPQAGGVPPPAPDLATWDVSAITNNEMATVRRFLQRRHQLTPQARGQLATELAARLRPKVGGAPAMADERFLENIDTAKAHRA